MKGGLIIYMIWYILLTAIGLPPGGSSTVHIYTQTVHKTTQLIWEERGLFHFFAFYTVAFALQLRKKHGKTSVRVTASQNIYIYIYIYRVSQEECARLREVVPYVKVYRYNPKHLCPKLNGYGDNGRRKCGLLAFPRTVPVS